jgi:hypothetical protein
MSKPSESVNPSAEQLKENAEETYVPLYPLLANYWSKPLAKIPKVLRSRVAQACEQWDEDGFYPRNANDADRIAKRQSFIREFDLTNDPVHEFNTWQGILLYLQTNDGNFWARERDAKGAQFPHLISEGGYGRDGGLARMTKEAQDKGDASIERNLRDIASQLKKFCYDENLRTSKEPLLWRELFRYSKTLSSMREAAKDKNDSLVLALDKVIPEIEFILDVDRGRVGAEVVAGKEAAPAAKVEDAPDTNLSGKGWLTQATATVGQPALTTIDDETGLTPTEKKIRAIEKLADRLGYQRQAIPNGGKAKLMGLFIQEYAEQFGAGKDPFLGAWKAARKQGRIKMANHKKFLPK